MIIDQVSIEGFMPFREKAIIGFDDGQVISIVGEYEGEEGRSNRAGKSSFIDAVRWCLYGKSRARTDVEIINEQSSEANVAVRLKDPMTGEKTTIRRRRNRKNESSLELSGAEGGRKDATQNAINRLIGLDAREFELTAFFKQNEISQFFEADPVERKEILLRWIRRTDWRELASHANELLTERRRREEQVRATIAAIPDSSQLDVLKAKRDDLIKDREALVAKTAEATDLKVRALSVLEQLKGVEQARADLKRAEQKVDDLKRRRPENEASTKRKEELKTLLAKDPLISSEKKAEAVRLREAAIRASSEATVKLRAVEDEIASAKKNRTGVCPILREPCDRIKITAEYKESVRSRVAEFTAEIKRQQEAIDFHGAVVSLAESQVLWADELERLRLREERVLEYERQIKEAVKEEGVAKKRVPTNAVEAEERARAALQRSEDSQRALSSQLRTVDHEIGTMNERIRSCESSSKKLEGAQAELAEILRDIADTRWVEYMFGPNGIPSIELENSFAEIERNVNLVLDALGSPFEMEFAAERELKDWESQCLACGLLYSRGADKCECGEKRRKKRRDELQIRIKEGDEERGFHMDSGGGKVLLSVAVRIALTLLARERSGSQWNVLFLDEIFGALDAVNRDAMADLVITTLRRDFSFRQIFIISHNPDVSGSIADVLRIVRSKDGNSVAYWA